jgi:hypothetical protein
MSDQEGKEWGGVTDKDWHEMSDEERSASMAEMGRVEFAEMFFEAIDEEIADRYERTGGRFPDWERAVARAKLDGVVPLMGSGSRVMATIPHRGLMVEGCAAGACTFYQAACQCVRAPKDTCLHPDAPLELALDALTSVPPTLCPLRKSTYHVALDPALCEDEVND